MKLSDQPVTIRVLFVIIVIATTWAIGIPLLEQYAHRLQCDQETNGIKFMSDICMKTTPPPRSF